MPIEISGSRTENRIEIPANLLATGTGTIALRGKGATITVAPGCTLRARLELSVGDGSSITFGARCVVGRLFCFVKDAGAIVVGSGVGFNGSCRILVHEEATISIGDSCLVASGVRIMASDMHAIIDLSTGLRINPASDVTIGSRVWLAEDVKILKGARIGAGSIIGLGSVVGSTPIPPNSLAVGIPAKVIRAGVSWRHSLE